MCSSVIRQLPSCVVWSVWWQAHTTSLGLAASV